MNTIDYYNKNAKQFISGTISADMHITQDKFLSYLKPNAEILDFGCGSGRDTKYFTELGYQVTATDGSEEICRLASEYTGITVRRMMFQELSDVDKYDGIWACSSILHLSGKGIEKVLIKMGEALKAYGVIYTSFKYGEFEGERKERYFTDFTEESFHKMLRDISKLTIAEQWITNDVRTGRGAEKWLNLILRKADYN